MLKRKIKGLSKALILGLIGFSSMSTLLIANNKIEVSAHNAYFVAISIDEANFKYVPTVIYEKNGFLSESHGEVELGNFSDKTTNGSWSVPVISYSDSEDGNQNQTEDDLKELYEGVVGSGSSGAGLVYTFPPVHGSLFTDKVHANGADEMLANRYVDYVVTGLNDAINYCISNSGKKNYSASTLKAFSAKLANKQTATLNGKTVTVTAGNPKKLLDGLTANDYVTVSIEGAGSITVPYQVKKGYKNSDERSGLSASYKKLCNDKDTEYLDWKYTVLQGNYNADVKTITYSSIDEISKPSAVETVLTDLIGGLLTALRNLLGLYPMEDLMLNGGQRDNNYYYGMMPSGWMNSSILLHIVCQTIAWTLMGFSFVRLIFKRQLQTMNIGERISLMEGFKNLISTAFLLGVFPLIFSALGKFNYLLVDVFANSSAFSSYMGTTQTMTAGALGSVIINIAFFVLACYYNFFYMLRGITIALLYGIAPICIFTLSLGGKYTQIFSSFMKELVSNIFIQTFHAICVAFFTSVTSTSQMKTFELLVVFTSFIPLTNFVRQNIMGLSGGITDHAGSITSMAGTAVSGAIGYAVGSAKGKVGSSGGGSSNTSTVDAGGAILNKGAQNALNTRQHFDSAKSAGKDGVAKSGLLSGFNGYASSYGGAKKVDLDLGNKKQEIGKNLFKASVGGAGRMMLGTAMMGSALGSNAIGDKRNMEMGIKNAYSGVANGGKALFNSGKNIYDVATDKSTYKSTAGLQTDSFTGMNGMYDMGENIMTTYDAYGDKDTGEGMAFQNDSIANSNQGRNMMEMYHAFTGTGDYAEGESKAQYRNEAIARYQNQGIVDCSFMKGTGQLGVVFDKNMAQNKKNFDFRNIGEISPYRPKEVPNKTSNKEVKKNA